MKMYARLLYLMLAVTFIATGVILLVNSNIGVHPWDVFHLGVANVTNLSHGRTIQLTGLILVLLSWFLGIKPGIGTVTNVFFVGAFVDLLNWLEIIPFLNNGPLYLQVIFFSLGVTCMGFGTAIFVSVKLGTGPRDSMMLAFSLRVPWKLGYIRTSMEVFAATVGYLLGGPLGIGTVLFALTIGFTMEVGLKLFKFIEIKNDKEAGFKADLEVESDSCNNNYSNV